MSVARTVSRLVTPAPRPTGPTVLGQVRQFGVAAWMAYQRDRSEWARRAASGGDPVLRLDVLDALLSLPAGLPVPTASVPASQQRLLRRAPSHVVDWTASTVTRRIVPPVRPSLAIVRSNQWAKALVGASRFASYCCRMVLVSALPADGDEALAEASFYGIGVGVGVGSTVRVVVEPEPMHDWQPTPAWWWFSEDIYRQVRDGPGYAVTES